MTVYFLVMAMPVSWVSESNPQYIVLYEGSIISVTVSYALAGRSKLSNLNLKYQVEGDKIMTPFSNKDQYAIGKFNYLSLAQAKTISPALPLPPGVQLPPILLPTDNLSTVLMDTALGTIRAVTSTSVLFKRVKVECYVNETVQQAAPSAATTTALSTYTFAGVNERTLESLRRYRTYKFTCVNNLTGLMGTPDTFLGALSLSLYTNASETETDGTSVMDRPSRLLVRCCAVEPKQIQFAENVVELADALTRRVALGLGAGFNLTPVVEVMGGLYGVRSVQIAGYKRVAGQGRQKAGSPLPEGGEE